MQIGFLGLGNMGQPMALRLLDGGFNVIGFDKRDDALFPLQAHGALRASDLSDLSLQSDVLIVSLPDLNVFRDVLLNTDQLFRGDRLTSVINTCTVGADLMRELDEVVSRRQIRLIDCPISGGPGGARAGTLSVMVSGDASEIERIRPILSLWAARSP